MVHHIINPWQYRHELFQVRSAFYPAPGAHTQEERHRAVALVMGWEHRGNCPHLVSSTALLHAAILNDVPGISSFCVRAAYSVAFSRFVTGLLDGYQDRKYKLSMYSIAKTIGLPASFVELRHQAAHEDLPPLNRLRTASRRALQWIWDFYWKNLPPQNSSESNKKKQISRIEGITDEDMGVGKRNHDLGTLREELRQEKELASESGSQPSIPESPVRDLESLKREMMILEEDIQSLDGSIDGQENSDLVSATNYSNTEAHPSLSVDSSGSKHVDEEDGNYGWDPWVGPWVRRPIGAVGEVSCCR